MISKIGKGVVISNLLSLTLGTWIAQTFLAVSILLTARQLGSADFGEYAASFSAAGLTSVLFNLGLDTWLLQSGSRNPEKLEMFAGSAFALKMLAGLPWLVVIVLILPYMNPRVFNPWMVLVGGLSILVDGFFSVQKSVFQVLFRNHMAVLFLVVARGVILLATIMLVVLGIKENMVYALIRLISMILAFCLMVLFSPIKPKINRFGPLKTAIRESVPFALSDIFALIYLQADVTLAAVILDKQEVGLYAPASSFINALFVIPNALFFVAVPLLIRILQHDRSSFCKMCGFVSAGFIAIGITLWLVVRYTSNFLPSLVLGASFERSGYLLSILSPIILLKSCNFASAAVLISVGWQNQRVRIQAVSAMANVALNLFLIRYLGITGIAIAYVISELVLLIGYIVLVIKWMYYGCSLSSIIR